MIGGERSSRGAGQSEEVSGMNGMPLRSRVPAGLSSVYWPRARARVFMCVCARVCVINRNAIDMEMTALTLYVSLFGLLTWWRDRQRERALA